MADRAYVATGTNSTNNCGGQPAGDLYLVPVPRQNGATFTLEGISATSAIPADVAGDRLTFSTPFAVDSYVVTLSGDWRFATDRHSFTGTTSAAIAANGHALCTFSWTARGSHPPEPVTPTPPPINQPATSADVSQPSGGPPSFSAHVYNPGGPFGPGPIYPAGVGCERGRITVYGGAVGGSLTHDGLVRVPTVELVTKYIYLFKYMGGSTWGDGQTANRPRYQFVTQPFYVASPDIHIGSYFSPAEYTRLQDVTFNTVESGFYTVIVGYEWVKNNGDNTQLGVGMLWYDEATDYFGPLRRGSIWCEA